MQVCDNHITNLRKGTPCPTCPSRDQKLFSHEDNYVDKELKMIRREVEILMLQLNNKPKALNQIKSIQKKIDSILRHFENNSKTGEKSILTRVSDLEQWKIDINTKFEVFKGKGVIIISVIAAIWSIIIIWLKNVLFIK